MPVRALVVMLTATLYVTVPLPVPLPPAPMVIHGTLLTALHEQPLVVVTLTVLAPPDAATFCDVGDSTTVHVVPLCETVTACPATVSVPVRAVALVLAATSNVAKAGPVRELDPLTVIHPELLVTLHVQSDDVVTAVLCEDAPDTAVIDRG